MTRISLGVVLLLAACHPEVVKSAPEATVYAAGPVAVGTPLPVNTTWEGLCKYDGLDMAFGAHWGGGSEGNTTFPCHEVEHTVSVTCDGGMCTTERGEGGIWHVVPTKPGVLLVHATLHPTGVKKAKTIDLPPIEVKTPDAASVATCYVARDTNAQFDVQLKVRGAEMQHESAVKIKGGEACKTTNLANVNELIVGHYACPVQALDATVVASGKDFQLEMPVHCTALMVRPPGGSATVSKFEPQQYSFRTKLVEDTRDGLKEWGWRVDSQTEGTDRTTIVASKLGAVIEIVMSQAKDTMGFDRLSWEHTVKTGAVMPVDQLPGVR